jgi:hypothetical protein
MMFPFARVLRKTTAYCVYTYLRKTGKGKPLYPLYKRIIYGILLKYTCLLQMRFYSKRLVLYLLMDEKIQPAPLRRVLVNKLAMRFSSEYKECMSHYTPVVQAELAASLKTVFENLLLFAGAADEKERIAAHAAALEVENTLLKKYGRELKPYRSKKFMGYFFFDTVLPDKEIFTTEEYNALPGEQQCLSATEASTLAWHCIRLLDNELPLIMLEIEPEGAVGQGGNLGNADAENGSGFTRSRQLLAIHFLLSVGFGIEPHTGNDMSSLARLAHLLTGTPYTSLQNSEIYKKYRRLPNIKNGLPYISDLQYIRGFFNEIGLQKVIEAIDTETSREQVEMAKKK